MRTNSLTALLALTTIAALLQTAEPLKRAGAVALPSSQFLNQPGPTFVVPESQLSHPLTVITYGDTRFTDPANTTATNPKVRQWLVQRIAEERPDAVLLNGDLPLA